MTRGLADYVSELDEPGALLFVEQALSHQVAPAVILEQARDGMTRVGEKFAQGEYFVPELIFSGEILRQIVQMLEPHLRESGTRPSAPRIVLGTVAGDIHDIGKNLVKFMLDVSGFGVLDLGTDVPVQRFVDSVRESGASVIALSGFLTLAFSSMKTTTDALREAGLRDKVHIMVGGGQVDERICRYVGADAWGTNAMDAVKYAKIWLGE